MKYSPGGYSWLGIAPETEEEKKFEHLEKELYDLRASYKKTKDAKLLKQIEELEKQIQALDH